MLKQVIIVRKDLKMPKGKFAVQCSHASVEAVLISDKEKIKSWQKDGAKKVLLKVGNEEELLKYYTSAKKLRLKTVLIKDSGKTFFKKPTITCIGIGPDAEEKIDRVSGKLKII
ncbi:peptidyl-tRNA hydrolase [Candidatus Woesearchaeota archaeon]|nr:peptidyl-tRNA hydrolase [Candidatus Woesearchaeota archaeon]